MFAWDSWSRSLAVAVKCLGFHDTYRKSAKSFTKILRFASVCKETDLRKIRYPFVIVTL